MAKFGKNAKPAFKKAVLKDQYERLTATKDRTLKQVREDYVANMWPLGDWTFRADYKVLEIDNGKYVFQSVTHPARDYKLLNIGDGYCEVVSKYRA